MPLKDKMKKADIKLYNDKTKRDLLQKFKKKIEKYIL